MTTQITPWDLLNSGDIEASGLPDYQIEWIIARVSHFDFCATFGRELSEKGQKDLQKIQKVMNVEFI